MIFWYMDIINKYTKTNTVYSMKGRTQNLKEFQFGKTEYRYSHTVVSKRGYLVCFNKRKISPCLLD